MKKNLYLSLLPFVAFFALVGVAHATAGSCAYWNTTTSGQGGAGYLPQNYTSVDYNAYPTQLTSDETPNYSAACANGCEADENTYNEQGECETGTEVTGGLTYCYCYFYANGCLYNTGTTANGNLQYYDTVACTISGCNANAGNSCTSSANACGSKNTGTINCSD